MKHSITIQDLSELDRAAKDFLQEIGDKRLIAFYAPMGAGKTTFTTAICRQLGVEEDAVGSPTFAIVNEYRTSRRADGRPSGGEMMYHFDFYRLDNAAEALDIGFYDYIDSGCLCIMEWPENIEEILPEETLRVSISVNPDLSRTVSWED